VRADPCASWSATVSIEEPDGTVIPLGSGRSSATPSTALHDDRAVIVLKARRLGLSWIFLAYALWLAIFQQGIRILILCKTEGDASELLDRIRRMRDRIAEDPTAAHILAGLQQPKKVRDAVTTLDVGASTIKALVGTPAAARSETAGLVSSTSSRSSAAPARSGRRAADHRRRRPPRVVSTGNGSRPIRRPRRRVRQAVGARSRRRLRSSSPSSSRGGRPDRDEAWKQAHARQLGDPDRFRTEYPEVEADAFVSPTPTSSTTRPTSPPPSAAAPSYDDLPDQPPAARCGWASTGASTPTSCSPGASPAAASTSSARSSTARPTSSRRPGTSLTYLREHELIVTFERFDAAEPILHNSFRKQFRAATGYSPRWLKIPFSKYKQLAIKYGQLLLRRSHEGARHALRRDQPDRLPRPRPPTLDPRVG
jgi:hypothetical protein